MLRIVLVLLATWIVLGIPGAVLRGLFWLTAIAAVLFVATAFWGWFARPRKR